MPCILKEVKMFLKCGQKNNTRYTFGLRKEQREEIEVSKEAMGTIHCSSCGKSCNKNANFCRHCGAKI